MQAYGLSNALMLAFSFASSFHGAVLLHASCIRQGGLAYAFTAKSGTGKSTHTGLWMSHIEGADLINDDNPAIRIISGRPLVFGTPWSGKTPCHRPISAPLGALTLIERAPANSIERLSPTMALAALLPACSKMKWDHGIHTAVCDTLSELIGLRPVFCLHCLPNREAAILAHATFKDYEQR